MLAAECGTKRSLESAAGLGEREAKASKRGTEPASAANGQSSGSAMRGSPKRAPKPNKPVKDTKVCNLCDTALPKSAFPVKGACCRSCENAKESLMYLLKQTWQKQYKAKYGQLKANKEKYKRQVLAHKLQRVGNAHRQLLPDVERLESSNYKRSIRGQRLRKKKFMTFQAYEAYKASPLHGGLSPDQVKAAWAELTKAKSVHDHKGICSGVAGFARYRVELSSTEASGSESGAEDSHTRAKTGKSLDQRDVADFREGVSSFDASVPLPPELAAEEAAAEDLYESTASDRPSVGGGAASSRTVTTQGTGSGASSTGQDKSQTPRDKENEEGKEGLGDGQDKDGGLANADDPPSKAGAKWKRAEAVASASVALCTWKTQLSDECMAIAQDLAAVQEKVVDKAAPRHADTMKIVLELFHRRSLLFFAFCADNDVGAAGDDAFRDMMHVLSEKCGCREEVHSSCCAFSPDFDCPDCYVYSVGLFLGLCDFQFNLPPSCTTCLSDKLWNLQPQNFQLVSTRVCPLPSHLSR